MQLSQDIKAFIECVERLQVIIPKIKKVFLSLKNKFVLANSANAEPDEMPHSSSGFSTFHCLKKYSFVGFQSTNGFNPLTCYTDV